MYNNVWVRFGQVVLRGRGGRGMEGVSERGRDGGREGVRERGGGEGEGESEGKGERKRKVKPICTTTQEGRKRRHK